MGAEVGTRARAQHGEQCEASGEGRPAPVAARSDSSAADDAIATQQPNGAENGGRSAHRDVGRAVVQRVEEVAACPCGDRQGDRESRPENAAQCRQEESARESLSSVALASSSKASGRGQSRRRLCSLTIRLRLTVFSQAMGCFGGEFSQCRSARNHAS